MSKRPTISDVAQRANVSKATVSHVMNHTRFVSPETKQRVVKTMAELGYWPNAVARSLSTSKTRTIGVLLADVSHYHFAQVLQGIEEVLMPLSYSIIICNTAESSERERHYLEMLLRQRADGIIAAAASPKWDLLPEFERHNTPIVFVDRDFEALRGPFVGVDNVRGAYMGTTHLIERGYRRLAILAGDTRLPSVGRRLEGFREALHDHGISLPDEWVIDKLGHEREALRQLLARADRPTAIFCSVTSLSLVALSTLYDMGLTCPADIALVGFDDHAWAAVSAPSLTVVRQPSREMGRISAQILLSLIDHIEPIATPVMLDCELIVRQSSGFRRDDLS